MSVKTFMQFVIVLLFMSVGNAADAREETMTIGLIGDSTVATTYGWGPALAARCNERATVLNYAKNGATLESLSGKLDTLLLKSPDFVLIQFGHNDMKRYDAAAYGAKLTGFVERVTRTGGKAIILSSVTRRHFDEQGRIKPQVMNGRSLPAFAAAARKVAVEHTVPFIDLYAISIEHHNAIGPGATAAYNFTETDKTHFSKAGAAAIADLIIQELKVAVPELAACLK